MNVNERLNWLGESIDQMQEEYWRVVDERDHARRESAALLNSLRWALGHLQEVGGTDNPQFVAAHAAIGRGDE